MEYKKRIQVVIDPAVHSKLVELVPSGLRSGVINEAIKAILALISLNGIKALYAVRKGEITFQITKEPKQ